MNPTLLSHFHFCRLKLLLHPTEMFYFLSINFQRLKNNCFDTLQCTIERKFCFSTVMSSPRPAFQECTGSCHENVSALKAVSSDLRSTDGLTVMASKYHLGRLSTILQYFTHTMKPSDPLLLADVCCCEI